jgi:hypothetical protein
MSCNDEMRWSRSNWEALLKVRENELDQHTLLKPLAEHIHFATETRGSIMVQCEKDSWCLVRYMS